MADEKPKSSIQAFVSIGEKIAMLLEKTKESIIADIKNDAKNIVFFTGDANAVNELGMIGNTRQIIDFIDLIFSKMGIDFSDADNLQKFGKRLNLTIEKIEGLAEIIQKTADAVKSDTNNSNAEDNAAEFFIKFVPLLQQLVETIKDFSDTEIEKIAGELDERFLSIDVKAVVKRIVNYTVMTLLKNAQEVFADEIEFVQLKIELAKDSLDEFKNDIKSQIEDFKKEINADLKQTKGDIENAKKKTTKAFKQIYKSFEEFEIDVNSSFADIQSDTKKRAAELYLKLTNFKDGNAETRLKQFFDENADVFAEIARAFSISYSILDFFGIIQHKKFIITIPDDLIKVMRNAKDSVAGVLGNADKKLVSIASGVDEDIKAFGDDMDKNIKYAGSSVENKVRDKYNNVVEELKSAAIVVDNKATEITNEHIKKVQTVQHELSEVSSMLGISQASIQTVQLQLATMAVISLDDSLKNGGDAIKNEIASVQKQYNSIKSAINDIYSGNVSDIQKKYAEITKGVQIIGEKTDKFIDKLDNFSYAVDYITIDWSKTKTLFTQPVKHFKSLYTVDSVDDAKELASRIMDILHLINPNIPTFDNLLNMLETLLKKLRSRLMNLVNEWRHEVDRNLKEIKRKAINFLKPLIDKIQAIIDFIKGLATQLKGEMMQVVENLKLVMNSVGKNIEVVANCYYRQLVAIKENAENNIEKAVTEAEKELTAVKKCAGNAIEDTADEINKKITEVKNNVNSAYNIAKRELEDRYKFLIDNVVDELKADTKNAKKALTDKLDTIKSAQLDLEDELLRIIIGTPIQVPSLKGFNLNTSILEPALAGFLNVDIETDLSIESLGDDVKGPVNDCFKEIKRNITSTFNTITSESHTYIANWAESVGASMMTVMNPAIWVERLDNIMTQLEVEFNGDMSTIKDLVSADGTKSLVTNFGVVKSNLAENLDINSYINIVKTAVSDVILPNPDLYFSSFKEVVKKILENIKKHLQNLVGLIKNQISKLQGAAQKRVQDIHDSLKATLTNLEEAFNAKIEQGKRMGELLKKMVEDMATQMWKRIKSELINPLINSLKAYITSVVRQVIRLAVEKIVDRIMVEVFPEVNYLLNQVINAAQNAHNAAVQLHKEARKTINDVINKLSSDPNYENIKALAMATYDFAMSDKSVPDIIALVKAIFNSIPNDAKKEFSDLLPSIPNSITDFCKNMEYEADINNMFVCVTLLDLGKLTPTIYTSKSVNGSVDCKVHMLMQIEDYVIKPNTNKTTQALAFRFSLSGGAEYSFKLGENNELKIGGSGDVKNIGFSLTKDIEGCGHVHGILGNKTAAPGENFNALAFIQFFRTANTPALWLSTEYLDIKAKNYPIIVYVGYNPFEKDNNDKYAISQDMLNRLGIDPDADSSKGFQAGFLAALEEVELVLKLRNNKMLANFLEDDISLSISVYVGYDKNVGLRIGGGAKFHISFDLHNKKLGPLHLNTFDIDAGSLGSNFGSLGLNINSNFAVDFGALTLSFDNLGLGFDCLFLDPVSFDLMKPDFGVHFNWPTGIGIAIDATAVKGAGLLSINVEEGTFMGVIELKVVDKFGVDGYVLCDTGAKPGHFFSLATMISASFSPGIPLGMGFSLTAVGGALGINRKLDRKALTEGVRQGTLESVFFVQDIKNHLAEIEKNAQKFFPAKKKQFYLGLLGQISFEPVVKCNFGLMLQMPDPTEIIIVGALKVSAGEAGDKVLCINVYFAGGINFQEGIWFDASIVDSKILLLDLSGDMAFRLFWGGSVKGFLMTIGGFHPAYKPEEAMMVSNLKRLSIGLNYSIVKMSLDTYIAITSNTFQIGADFKLQVGWKKFGLVGYFGFDALFQFRPFMFMFNVRAGVSVILGKMTLMTISLNFDASGPRPWDIKGKAYFKFLFIAFPVKFHLTWGKEQVYLPEAEILSFALLLEQANNNNNWTSHITSADDDVMLSHDNNQQNKSDGEQPMVIQPFSSISFNQNIIPFKTKKSKVSAKVPVSKFDFMDICNDARPVDFNGFELTKVWCGDKSDTSKPNNAKYEFACNDFAPSLYKGMTPSQKLKSPSYERYNSGFTVIANENEQTVTTNLIVTVDHILGDFQSEECKAFKPQNHTFAEPQFSPNNKSDTKRYVNSLSEQMSKLPQSK